MIISDKTFPAFEAGWRFENPSTSAYIEAVDAGGQQNPRVLETSLWLCFLIFTSFYKTFWVRNPALDIISEARQMERASLSK